MKDIKIIAAILLLVGVFSLPYGYYEFLRWAIMIIACYSAYNSFTTNSQKWGWIFVVTAVLFNPIWPFYLDKSTWQILDIITSGVFFISLKK